MASSLGRNLKSLTGFILGNDPETKTYNPRSSRGKRKVVEDLRRSSETRCTSTTPPAQIEEDFGEATERRTSLAELLYDGTKTYAVDSDSDMDADEEPPRRSSIMHQPQQQAKLASIARTASPEIVRERRQKFLQRLGGKRGISTEEDIHDSPQESDNTDQCMHLSTLEQEMLDSDLREKCPEASQAQIEDTMSASPSTSESNFETDVSTPITARHSRNNHTDLTSWSFDPNGRAHELNLRLPLKTAAAQIRSELREPEYVFRDAEIRDMIWQIMDKMVWFSRSYFSFDFEGDGKQLKKAFASMAPETVKIIGCVATGGPGAQEGWKEFFTVEPKRRALVCAIVGNVLVEQVFQHACFGASEYMLVGLSKIQEEMQDKDGFDRQRAYANYLRPLLFLDSTTLTTPPNFIRHVKVIVASLWTHLSPILQLSLRDPQAFLEDDVFDSLLNMLFDIVTTAGLTSLVMRTDPHTIYYVSPIFKEEVYDKKYMECFNRYEMDLSHPRHSMTAWEEGISEEEKERAKKNYEPLTQIKIMDGFTTYRRGGWETADSTIWEPKWDYERGAEHGLRVKVLVHAWVYCRWGRPRRFVDGKPQDDPKEHGVAWRAPGFVEFEDVEGVKGEAN